MPKLHPSHDSAKCKICNQVPQSVNKLINKTINQSIKMFNYNIFSELTLSILHCYWVLFLFVFVWGGGRGRFVIFLQNLLDYDVYRNLKASFEIFYNKVYEVHTED